MSRYDAVVIGSGNAGMSAALTLAHSGKKVLVLEQHNLPGGCASSFVRGRFEFDATLHEFNDIGHVGDWGIIGSLLMEKYQLDIDWYDSPDCYRIIGLNRKGEKVDFTLPTGVDECIEAMAKQVPGSREPMKKFMELCDECCRAYRYFNDHMFDKFDKNDFVKTDSIYFMKHFPNFLKVAEQPYNQVLRRLGMPEDAIDILDAYWSYIGADYERFSFVVQVYMMYTYITEHPAIAEGTAHAITVAGVEKLRELGSELWQNVRALKVKADNNGRITGVETTAGFVETNYVIANMHPYTAYTQLLDEKIDIPERELKRISAEKPHLKIANIYLGLNKSIEELGIDSYTYFVRDKIGGSVMNNVVGSDFSKQNEAVVVIYNVANPNASPEGTTIMTFSVCFSEDVWADVTQENYVQKKAEIFKPTLKIFEDATGIIIHDCIEEIEIASPWTFAHYINTPQGAVYGTDWNNWNTCVSRMMAVKKDQPIHGFKICGAAGARGLGYSQTYANGNDAAKLLLAEMEEDSRS